MKQQPGYEAQSKALPQSTTRVILKQHTKTMNKIWPATKINHSPRPTKKDHSCLTGLSDQLR